MHSNPKNYLTETQRREKYRANTPIEDLLWKQSKGMFLTAAEKLSISRYQEKKRKSKLTNP